MRIRGELINYEHTIGFLGLIVRSYLDGLGRGPSAENHLPKSTS